MTPRTADLSDAHEGRLEACSLQLRSFGRRAAFEGAVSTVQCSDDNGLVRVAVSEPGRGRVLVVDGGGSLDYALVGDALVGAALVNGWSGLIVNGAVRDVVALSALDLGVLALGTNPRRAGRQGSGQRDVVISFGGATFRPRARVFADDDGILVGTTDTASLI